VPPAVARNLRVIDERDGLLAEAAIALLSLHPMSRWAAYSDRLMVLALSDVPFEQWGKVVPAVALADTQLRNERCRLLRASCRCV